MKLNLVLILGLASMAVASPVVQRDDATDLVTLMSTVKNHTASISEWDHSQGKRAKGTCIPTECYER